MGPEISLDLAERHTFGKSDATSSHGTHARILGFGVGFEPFNRFIYRRRGKEDANGTVKSLPSVWRGRYSLTFAR